MLAPRKDIARLQSTFYRDQFYKMLNLLLLSVGVMFLLVGAIIYLIFHQAPIHYYANTTDGRILEMPKAG